MRLLKIDAVIHMQKGPPQKRFFEGCSSPFMRLAQHFAACFALGASKRLALSVEKNDVLRPGIAGMSGSMAIRLRPCMSTSPAPRGRVVLRVTGTALYLVYQVYGIRQKATS